MDINILKTNTHAIFCNFHTAAGTQKKVKTNHKHKPATATITMNGTTFNPILTQPLARLQTKAVSTNSCRQT